jgi:hypothetical protein
MSGLERTEEFQKFDKLKKKMEDKGKEDKKK